MSSTYAWISTLPPTLLWYPSIRHITRSQATTLASSLRFFTPEILIKFPITYTPFFFFLSLVTTKRLDRSRIRACSGFGWQFRDRHDLR